MNKNINKFFAGIAMLVVLLSSCKKEGDQYFTEDGSFSENKLSASSPDVVLTQADENSIALTFNWGAASFGEKVIVRYILQLDIPEDTSGSNAWGKAKNYPVDNAVFTKSFTGKDLNNILTAMALPAGAASDIVFRVKADVPQYNGSVSSLPPAYSNTIKVKITTYATSLYIPGAYQGWNPGTAPLLNPIAGLPGLYEAYVNMPGSGIQYFKYTNAPNWNNTNYGDGGNGTFSTDGAAGGLNVPDGGYYELTADLNTNKWTATKTTWAIIGDATPGGWGSDTQMAYDALSQVWRVTCNMVSNGSFKFRANNSWAINFGLNSSTGKIEYADNPFLPYNGTLANLSVPSNGNYTITLDLSVSQRYTFSLVKN
ncbi:MAG: SusE domain-containing protein [Gloeobacteraceae cyanobacterium ES-bin-316]|nr:SusE domain-containing protein [Ferruginibacter sp.]